MKRSSERPKRNKPDANSNAAKPAKNDDTQPVDAANFLADKSGNIGEDKADAIGIPLTRLKDMLWNTASELTKKPLDVGDMFDELATRLELADIDNVDIEFRKEKPADIKNTLDAITPWYLLYSGSEKGYITWFEHTSSTENPDVKRLVLVFVPDDNRHNNR